MVKYYIKTDGRLRELEEARPGCWVNIAPPFSHEELEEVAQSFEVPLDFLTDSLDLDERSRYEREEDVRFILLNSPILNENEDENDAIYVTVPIGIIITLDNIITISAFDNPIIRLFLDNKVKNFNPSDEKMFILQIFEHNVYRFLTCLKKLNSKRNLIEQELYDSSRNQELKLLLSIEKSLVYFLNSLSANELLLLKMKRTDFLHIAQDEDLTDLFEDIIIDNSQAMEMSKVYSDILGGTMDAYGSIISNNLNLTIRRLTLITILLMVPTLIASFYGMNISMPFQENNFAFLGILIIALILSAGMAWYFQRKRMF